MKRKFVAAIIAVCAVILCSLLIASHDSAKESSSVKNPIDQIIKNIPVNISDEMIQENLHRRDFVLLDVRTAREFAEDRIDGAKQIDFYSRHFSKTINGLDKGKTYLVYSETGKRSKYTLDLMEELGFYEVYNMEGGLTLWKNLGYPTLINNKLVSNQQ